MASALEVRPAHTPRPPRLTTRRVEPWTGPAWVWGLLGVLLLVAWRVAPDFAQWTNISNILAQSVPLAIVAMGETIVILTGGLDISVAVTMSMADTMASGIMNGQDARIVPAVLLTLLAGAVIGAGNGIVVAKARVPAFIVTLGMASVVQGIVFGYTNSSTYGTPAESVVSLGFESWGPLPALVVLFVPVLLVGLFLQNRTRAGRHLYAAGGHEGSARLAGINVDRIKVGAYIICGVMAALAGIVLTTRTGGGEPLAGTGYDWDAIAAVVIGGTSLRGGKGGVAGTLGAVIILGVVDNVMNLMNVSTFWQSAVKGGIVLSAVFAAAFVALQPLEAIRLRREAGKSSP